MGVILVRTHFVRLIRIVEPVESEPKANESGFRAGFLLFELSLARPTTATLLPWANCIYCLISLVLISCQA